MKNKVYYLYGAAIQGIQNFIFQTNDLKDIVGASELVEEICTTAFEEFIEGQEPILHAAGNIKQLFQSKEACEKAVRYFPAKVMNIAPGITISQAVVAFDDGNFEAAANRLEQELRIQRNRPTASMTLGLMGMVRSRKTGLPAVCEEEGDYYDSASRKKREVVGKAHYSLCQKSFGIPNLKDRIAYDIGEIASGNNWIAIVHADGNGLGNVVRQIGRQADVLKDFSFALNKATCESAQEAFKAVESKFRDSKFIPIRPIVLGGDDMTIVIRGDLAMEYTKSYLETFEQKTKVLFGEIVAQHPDLNKSQRDILNAGLTACAGIAFIKSSYPFYYGYDLAESLCARAKKDAKGFDSRRAPSCLMFHKVQDSFVEDYEEIVERELIPCAGNTFVFGPYYLESCVPPLRWSVNELLSEVDLLDSAEGNAVKSGLRQWMTLLHDKGEEGARQKKERMLSLLENEKLRNLVEKVIDEEGKRHAVYDVLSLRSIYQTSNK